MASSLGPDAFDSGLPWWLSLDNPDAYMASLATLDPPPDVDAAFEDEPPLVAVQAEHGQQVPVESARVRRWLTYDARLGRVGPVHVRRDGPGGKRLWWEAQGDSRLVDRIYLASDLAGASLDTTIVVTEGEKAADAVRDAGFLAAGVVCGAGATPGHRVLRLFVDRAVVLWPDNDDDGQKLMSRIAERLERLGATRVALVDWPDAPPKGDAADTDRESIDRLVRTAHALPMLPEIHSAAADVGTGRTNALRFQTARELTAEMGSQTRWVIDGWIALAALVELVGKAKSAGKTTLICAMTRALLDGTPFLDSATIKTPVVLLTEQSPSSLRPRLARFGLADRDDLLILTWHEARGVSWADIIAAAVAECRRIGAHVLIVDTLPAFAGIRGDAENDAGAALAAIEPLQVAAADGLAVVVVRHERKGGGEVGDSARGSSAFTGAVDIVLRLARERNPTRPGIRILSALSRFDETPEEVVLELVDDQYHLLGDQAALALAEVQAAVLAAIDGSDEGSTMDQLSAAMDAKRTSIQAAIKALLTAGGIVRIGKGVKGNPYRYHRPDAVSAGDPPFGGNLSPAERPASRSDRPEAFRDELGVWEPDQAEAEP